MVFGGLLPAQMAWMFENSSKNYIFQFFAKKLIFSNKCSKILVFSGSWLIFRAKKINLQNTILLGCLLKTWLKLAMSVVWWVDSGFVFFSNSSKKLFNLKLLIVSMSAILFYRPDFVWEVAYAIRPSILTEIPPKLVEFFPTRPNFTQICAENVFKIPGKI
jgi:hypothetical protein